MVRFTTTITTALTALGIFAAMAPASPADSASAGKQRASKLVGHYHGHNKGGRPISFDVAGGKPAIENFSIAVDVECWNDYNHDGQSDRLVAQITGFEGKVRKNGTFDIYYAPDDDTEFEFSGTIDDRKAKVKAVVGGTFNADGTPSLTGPYQCDSWGAKYRAKQS